MEGVFLCCPYDTIINAVLLFPQVQCILALDFVLGLFTYSRVQIL